MTLEAAVLLPLLLFMMINLFSIIDIYRIQGAVVGALWSTARNEMALDAAANSIADTKNKKTPIDIITDFCFEEISSRDLLTNILGEDEHWREEVPSGFWMDSEKDFRSSDIKTLSCRYEVRPMFIRLNNVRTTVNNMCTFHSFSGYDLSEKYELKAEIKGQVYITPSGEAYHLSADCPYLNPSIQEVKADDVDALRNKDGAKYNRCGHCTEENTGTVFITDYGRLYHTSGSCSSLVRHVLAVSVEEIGERHLCSKCGS